MNPMRRIPRDLTAGDKHVLERIVDRLHVGASQYAVARYVASRVKRYRMLPRRLRRDILRVAFAHHKANQNLYHNVMTGRL